MNNVDDTWVMSTRLSNAQVGFLLLPLFEFSLSVVKLCCVELQRCFGDERSCRRCRKWHVMGSGESVSLCAGVRLDTRAYAPFPGGCEP